jgi:membrane protease YdiL (CAAX protease family)
MFGSSQGAGLLVKLGLFSLLVFIVIPRLMKLPLGDVTFVEYLRAVGLRTGVSWRKIIVLALSCYAIFAMSQLLGSLLFYSSNSGEFELDFSRHGFFDSRSIVAGIFEEIVMRGVMVTVLLGTLSKRRAIVISAAVFGGIHLLNLLNPESNVIWVSAQAVWAFAFGVIYAYLFVITRTILPLILIHYSVNATGGVWFRGLETQDVTSALYGIPFFGVLPAGLAILWGRFLWQRLQADA